MLARVVVAALVLTAATTTATAQWPASSSPNLPIGDGSGEQTLVKVATTSDGGCYVGWFDNRSGSYAVYLQRFDATGVEQWQHGGILVSGNPQSSSLVDWDLIADSADHCVLVFTDTRAGGDLDVYAYRIAPNATFVWGANGLPLSQNADYEPNPRVCQTSDGRFVVVWPNTVTRTIQLQRILGSGVLIFPGDGIAIPGEAGATPGFARVAPGDFGTGDVIVSWVRTTAFSGNKHVHAQKFDEFGNALWNGGTRVVVFDQASVPIAHEPRLVTDHTGGACLAWHFASGSQFQVRVQHLATAGTEMFPHNGVDVSTSTNSRFDPAIVWARLSSELLVAWNERNVAQTTWGIGAQKLDSTGASAWGPTGATLLPIDNVVKFAPVAAPLRSFFANDGFAVSVLVESLGAQQKSVQLFGVDNAGTAAFPPVVVSTFASDKLRLAHAANVSGTHVLAWTDQRQGHADIWGAAVDARGLLGVSPSQVTLGGCGLNPVGSFAVADTPAIGTGVAMTLTNPQLTQPFGSLAFFFVGTGTTGFPCGVVVPGFGMSAPGAAGELLIDTTQPYSGWFAGVWVGIGFTTLPVPFAPPLIGTSVYVQGLLVDPLPGAPIPFGLTNGARLVIGS
jgi:hypothetical protein